MKVLIIYYSQTGNTQKIARVIRDSMRQAGHCVDLRYLKKARYEELNDYDLIGFGSPIWFEMPPNMRRFIEDMPKQNKKPAFSFCTHGTLPALYFPIVVPRLQRQGFEVLGWKGWYGNCTVQIFPEPYYTAGHPDEQDFAEAAEFAESICKKAEAYLSGDSSVIPEAPMPDMLPIHASVAIEHLGGSHNIHGRLVRDPEKCLYPKCHICMDHCAMDYIDLKAGRFGSCTDACDDPHGCTYCELLCPTGAIHPAVPYEEAVPAGKNSGHGLFEMVLAQAESEGKFRRKLPLEQVGSETPYYYVHNTHPRIHPLRFEEDE